MNAMYARLALARATAWVWRFRTLRRAERLLGGHLPETILSRRFAGGRITLDVSRSSTHRLLYLEGERFVAERLLLRSLVSPGFRIVDVGANIGYTARLLAQAAGKTGLVLCFEPSTDNLVELRRNCSATEFAPIQIEAKAVGNRNCQIYLSKELNATIAAPAGAGVTEVAEMVTLDSALQLRPDVLKIDVEGFEEQVLEGAKETLERYRPNLFLELHPHLIDEEAPGRMVAELSRIYGKLQFHRSATGRVRALGGRYLNRWLTERVLRIDDALAAAREDGTTIWIVGWRDRKPQMAT